MIKIFKSLFKQYGAKSNEKDKFSPGDIAEYYSRELTFIILRWIEEGVNISAKTLTNKYRLLVTNSLDDIIHNLIN